MSDEKLRTSTPTPSPSRSPSRGPRLFVRTLIAGCLVYWAAGKLLTPPWRLPHFHGGHHCHHSISSPYGDFPRQDDKFLFLPCTNATLPPTLDDPEPARSWAKLFDPDPSNWSWGNKTSSSSAHDEKLDNDPHAGRGIYLCGYLDVPLDYTNSSDPRIVRLAVTKYQVSGLARTDSPAASSRTPTPGSKSARTLVIEPGGPGGSGTSYVWRAGEEITERFSDSTYDVLGWDPRGVNATQPAVSCFPYDADRDRWFLLINQHRAVSPSPEAQLELVDAMHDATLRACRKRHGDLARFVSTAFVARDLERLREALSEDELTGYLVSYGTGIGQTYANMFPDSVGRMILDGTEYVRDHRLLGGFGWTALDNATDAWHDGFLGECLRAGPEHCALARPYNGKSDITLPDLDNRMRALVTSLVSRPLPGYTEVSGPSLVTYSSLVDATYSALYNAKSWPALAQMYAELEAGNSTLAAAFLEGLAWQYDPSLPRPPLLRPQSEELGQLVICADSYDAPEPPEGMAWWLGLWANMTSRSWISGNSRFFSVFPCRHFNDYWDAPAEVYRGDLNYTLKHPVLLIAETYDPATPLRNGRRLLAEMGKNARLIAHHGYGHSSRDTSNCTNSIAKAFILHGTLPEEGETACYANKKPYMYDVEAGAGDVSVFAGRRRDPVQVWREHLEEISVLNPGLLH